MNPSNPSRPCRPTPMFARRIALFACLLMFTGVAAGAFGAHALKAVLPAAVLSAWHTGVLYQLVHGLALLALTALMPQVTGPWLRRAALTMAVGTVLFSGSLYAIILSGARWLGPVTPIGGVILLTAWLLAALAFLRKAP